MAVWSDPDDDELHIDWARETAAAIEPWSLGGGYANYMQADEPIERIRAAFGEAAFERLRALKTTYDPANVLRRNQNVPPLSASAAQSGRSGISKPELRPRSRALVTAPEPKRLTHFVESGVESPVELRVEGQRELDGVVVHEVR